MNFAEARRQAEAAGQISGGADIYKYKEGDNRFRLMSDCLPHQGEFQGKPNFKWLCYVLDRRDNKVKVHFMPHSIYKSIEALQENPDYTFEVVPMPYDVTVRAEGAGTKEVKYNLMPARKETALTTAELAELDQQKPIKDVQKAIIEKRMKDAPSPGQVAGHVEPITDDDIAFAWMLPMLIPVLGALSLAGAVLA